MYVTHLWNSKGKPQILSLERSQSTDLLHWAQVWCAESHVIEMLLEAAAPAAVNAQDCTGSPPLHAAAAVGQSSAIEVATPSSTFYPLYLRCADTLFAVLIILRASCYSVPLSLSLIT